MHHRPHNLAPSKATARVILAYKNFAANKGVSHIGLGVAAMNTAATLRRHGYWVDIWPVTSGEQLAAKLAAESNACSKMPISHVVISAPWIPTPTLARMLTDHPDIDFAVVSHSNVGFLMADPNGIKLLRQGLELQKGTHNFTVAGNSKKFVTAWERMYGTAIQYLPNLYNTADLRHAGHRVPWCRGEPLRVGVFGATRPLKNMVTSVAAAVELGHTLRTDVEIFLNSGRTEGGGTVRDAIMQLVAGLRTTQIKELGWCSWPDFRAAVRDMNVLLSPSYTESFNMVTADGIAEGVASVVSEAIDWVPRDWVANADSVDDVARAARRLIADPHAVSEGQDALREYVNAGTRVWAQYLGGHS